MKIEHTCETCKFFVVHTDDSHRGHCKTFYETSVRSGWRKVDMPRCTKACRYYKGLNTK